MNFKNYSNYSYLLYLIIIILEVIGFIIAIKTYETSLFYYYTIDSNLLLLITSIIFLAYKLINSEKNIPQWIHTLKFSSVTSVFLTFFIVSTVLSWLYPGGFSKIFFGESLLYHHTLCPLLAIITLVLFDDCNLNEKHIILKSITFTIFYSVIMVILNILKIVVGPYPFLMVYTQPWYLSIIWFIIILFIVSFLAKVLLYLNNYFTKNN